MSNRPSIRQQVAMKIVTAGISSGEPRGETMLIRDGYYVGRRFEFSGATAVWMVERCQLDIYHESGELVASYAFPEPQPAAQAA